MSSDKNFFSFKVKTANGGEFNLQELKGKAVVVVNVASKCGFTPQYAGLEKLYQSYKDKGLAIIGFPCNQFGGQEPGSDKEVQQFCQMNYGVSFPVMAKIDVNGDKSDPVYTWLKAEAPGILGTEAIKWNFTKFLIGKDGKVIERFAPKTEPSEMAGPIEKALSA